MPREYARIRLSIAEDEDFEDLTPAAQWLYLRVLLPDPSLNNAGVCDWRPNRLIGKANGIDLAYILDAAAELEQQRYVLFDVATEEALIRTYIRNDELLRNPKMALSVVSGYQATASKTLRAFIVTEVLKARDEHPEFSSWEHEISKAEVDRLLTRKGSDSVNYTNQIEVPITNLITNPNPGADYQSDSVHIPCTYTNTSTPAPTPNTLLAPQDAPPKPKRGSRLDSDWMPPQSVIDEIKAECPHVDLEAEHRKFVDYWTDKTGKDATKISWEGTWRNWMRRAESQTPQGRPPDPRNVHKLRAITQLAADVRAQEQAELAVNQRRAVE